MRNKFIIKFKINDFFDRHKKADRDKKLALSNKKKKHENTAKFLVFFLFLIYARLQKLSLRVQSTSVVPFYMNMARFSE